MRCEYNGGPTLLDAILTPVLFLTFGANPIEMCALDELLPPQNRTHFNVNLEKEIL
jgi:hypothetical protein